MKRANIITSSVLALCVLLSFSCRRVFDTAKWEPELVFPIATGSISLVDLTKDTSVFKKDSTGLTTVVFRQKMDSLTLNVLDTFSAPPFYRNFKLESLKLEVPDLKRSITLGQVADTLMKDPNNALFGSIIKSMQGKPLSSLPLIFQSQIPPKLSFPVGTIPINLDQFFESATLKAGFLDVTISNQFPMNISRLDYNIANVGNLAVLVQETNIEIPKNTSFQKTYDLAGKQVEGKLNVSVPFLDLITDLNAIIDTNSAIEITMKFRDLQVESAYAVFPDQDVVSDRQAASLENMGEVELKEAVIEDGNVVMEVISTIQDSIYMTFIMPKTTKNGQALFFQDIVPPAPPNASRRLELRVPVSNYNLNLSSPPDYFNRFLYDFKARVKSGKKVFLSLKDSIVVNIYLKGVRPAYARGYLGSIDTTFSSSFTTDIFSGIQADMLEPEQVNMSVAVNNSLGVAGTIRFNALNASGPGGKKVTGSDPGFIGKDFEIAPATNPPFTPAKTNIKSTPASNFAKFVGIFPTSFEYDVKAVMGGADKDTNSFVFSRSKLIPELLIEMPLKAAFQGLVMRDTVDISPSQVGVITNGTALRVLATNGFPFSASIRLFFYPGREGRVVELFSPDKMQPAKTDPVTGRVTAPVFSRMEFAFGNPDLYDMTVSSHLVFEVRFDTPPGEKVKIYSDYSSSLALTGFVIPQLTK